MSVELGGQSIGVLCRDSLARVIVLGVRLGGGLALVQTAPIRFTADCRPIDGRIFRNGRDLILNLGRAFARLALIVRRLHLSVDLHEQTGFVNVAGSTCRFARLGAQVAVVLARLDVEHLLVNLVLGQALGDCLLRNDARYDHLSLKLVLLCRIVLCRSWLTY